ncbi:hypothetical protein ACFMBG_14865 [Leisingera sp. D0M16]|uniref:hypothetical protein n=1 Tax=Leisingera coralii TaxID=3351347 RepID=UPI003B82A68D
MGFDQGELSFEARVSIAIARYEEEKAKGKFDHLLSRESKLFLEVMRQSGLTLAQIECASKTEQNKIILAEVIELFKEKGLLPSD